MSGVGLLVFQKRIKVKWSFNPILESASRTWKVKVKGKGCEWAVVANKGAEWCGRTGRMAAHGSPAKPSHAGSLCFISKGNQFPLNVLLQPDWAARWWLIEEGYKKCDCFPLQWSGVMEYFYHVLGLLFSAKKTEPAFPSVTKTKRKTNEHLVI